MRKLFVHLVSIHVAKNVQESALNALKRYQGNVHLTLPRKGQVLSWNLDHSQYKTITHTSMEYIQLLSH